MIVYLNNMKKIVVMPVKNEEWILERTLACLELFADHIIIADQDSTDSTLEICKKSSKVVVIRNATEFHSSNVRKLLLDAAREFDGKNAIFSFDADEIPTDHILTQKFTAELEQTKPGTSFLMEWLQLWRTPNQYRQDRSVWSNSWKHFGFIDDRLIEYNSLNVINDHTSRIPTAALNQVKKLEFPKVLHYQFTDFERMLAKHRHYRIVELVNNKTRSAFLAALRINQKYVISKDERNIAFNTIPDEWTQVYGERIQIPIKDNQPYWFDLESLQMINEKGGKFFRWLDIWDCDWEMEANRLIGSGNKDISAKKVKDPRNILIKAYHNSILAISDILKKMGFIYTLLKLLKIRL
jgi:glycosyltransferase involved in cell wall biosynthesis